MKLFDRFSVKKLYDDLDYWIYIGVGSDIVELKDQRLEYKPLVQKNSVEAAEYWNGHVVSVRNLTPLETSKKVLEELRNELKLPWYKRPTFWHLARLNIKRIFTWK